jgi:PASTA domain
VGVVASGLALRGSAGLATGTATTATDVLSWNHVMVSMGILAGATLAVGILVIIGRRWLSGTPASQNAAAAGGGDSDFIRSWIAITLVIGLFFFCAISFAMSNAALRSTLLGGLIASVGSAIAFYFSTKSADKARQDMATAAAGTETVPNLLGKTVNDAAQALGKTNFRLTEKAGAAKDGIVSEQFPPANSDAPKGSAVLISVM